MSAAAIMEQSLECVADSGVDIVPLFYEHFFALHPEQRTQFQNDSHSYGTMANEIMAMLLALAEGEQWVGTMMHSHLMTHQSHGDFSPNHYTDVLSVFIDTLAAVAGDQWRPGHEAAWRAQADALGDIIAKHWPAPVA